MLRKEIKGGVGMKIRYIGHACFELELSDGRKVIFDPYESGAYGGALAYAPITGDFDIVISSHDHADHRSADVISRAKDVVEKEGEFDLSGVKVKTIPTYHDESGGSERGKNSIAVVEADGLKVVHLGDLGHRLTEKELSELKGADIVLVPVGGHFTIDAQAAKDVVEAIGPRLVIPMHYKTPKVDFPIKPVEDFTSLFDGAEKAGSSEIEVSPDNLPEGMKVVVLDYSN